MVELKGFRKFFAALGSPVAEDKNDPFGKYRYAGKLPKKLELGMNCYLDTVIIKHGGEVAQIAYEQIKKDPDSYQILNKSGMGISALFGVRLSSALKAEEKAIKLIEAREKTLPLLVNAYPEAEAFIGLNKVISVFNENLPKEHHLTVIKVRESELKSCSDKLSSYEVVKSNILYKRLNKYNNTKTKIPDYYNYIHIMKPVYEGELFGRFGSIVSGIAGRKVLLEFCIDDLGEMILVTSKKMKRELFSTNTGLTEGETEKMTMVYKYKPVKETIQKYNDLDTIERLLYPDGFSQENIPIGHESDYV